MGERTFSEREVAQIIERAVDRQAEAYREVAETGLTLEEIERVGRDVGIDPRHLRAAAAEVAAGAAGGGGLSQTNTHVVVERWLDGPLSLTAWEEMVGTLRERFGLNAGYGHSPGGVVSQVGNTYEWSHTSTVGVQTRVAVSARGERTRLRLSQLVGIARPEVEAPIWGAVLTLILGLLPALALFRGDTAMIIAVTTAAFVLLSVAVFAGDRAWRAKKLRRLDALADEIGRGLTASEPTVTASEPAALGDKRLDLDALPDLDMREAPVERGRERE